MKVVGVDGNALIINADTKDDTLVLETDGVVKVALDTLRQVIPSISQVYAALEESAIVKQKMRKDDIKKQIDDLQVELERIDKL